MRKIRKKFKRPKVAWDSDLIKENKKLTEEYGLRRKKEILISQEILRGFRQRARQLIAEQNEEREKILMQRLERIGLLTGTGKGLDDVLALNVRNLLDRRLQTIIFQKGLATSPLHARQMIVHGHVKINGRKVKFPSYLVPVDEEKSIEIVSARPRSHKPKPAEGGAEAGQAEGGEAASEQPAKEVLMPDDEEKPEAEDFAQ